MKVSKEQFVKEIMKRQQEKKLRKIDTFYAIRDVHRRAVKRAQDGH